MSYKAGIVKAITELKDRTGSSSIAIKKHMQAAMPTDKK
jgi:histone H1/5